MSKTTRLWYLGMALIVASCLYLKTGEAQSNTESGPKSFDQQTRETYNFRFGNDKIATPGNAASEEQPVHPARRLPKAEYCADCHQEAYSQWRQALHSNSFRTPFYRTSVNILARTKASNTPAIATVVIIRSAF